MQKLTYVPLAKHELPHVVYLLSDASDALLYVGVTQRTREESVLQLVSRKPWHDEVAKVELYMEPDLAAATEAQQRFIEQMRPRYNKPGKKRKRRTLMLPRWI